MSRVTRKVIGQLIDENDVTETPIKVSVNERGIVFIHQGKDHCIVITAPALDKLIEYLQDARKQLPM